MKIMIQTPYKKQQGFSLIEMMVSMVLGLFLIGGLTSMYLSSKKSDKVRAAVSDIEENARTTLNNLRLAIEHAGYKTVDNIPLDKPFQVPSDGEIQNKFCRDGSNLITNRNLTLPPDELAGFTIDGDVADDESDRLTVIYHGDNPDKGDIYFDCNGAQQAYFNLNPDLQRTKQRACSTDTTATSNIGMLNPREANIYNGLFIKKSDKTLNCVGSRSPTGVTVLAENIINMQIRFGVRSTDINDINTTIYKNATQVEAQNEWEKVISVQVAILVGSEKDILDQEETHEFDLLDETITLEADRKLYRTYSTTIHLPNRSRRELQSVTRGQAENT